MSLNDNVEKRLWGAVQIGSFIESIQLIGMNSSFSLNILFDGLNNITNISQQYRLLHFMMASTLQTA